MTIKELPEPERPYEKLELYGEKNLSNAELLAIIIKTGTKELTSIDIAREILNLNDRYKEDSLAFLKYLSIENLCQIKGIGRVKAIQLKAICELSSRMNLPSNYRKITVKEPNDIAKILMDDLKYEKKEIAKVVLLDNKCNILKIKNIAMGGNNFVNINMREILQEAVKENCSKIIIAHNHPSGSALPSNQDIEITKKLEKAGEILGVQLLDHIVIGNNEFTSIKTIEKWKDEFGKKIE